MRRFVKRHEALAIAPDALHSDHKAMWWDQAQSIPANQRIGNVEVVTIRGSLDHHRGFGSDCYEDILERVECALAGMSQSLDANGEVEEQGIPSAVVLRIDSPGGVVSGLNETVYALQRMSAKAGIPLIAYVDEMAASAAYALSCACSEIYLPKSAIAGSVGVISSMASQSEADKKAGVRFVTITSGTRKADGHPHMPISDAAISAEQKRVDQLANQFFSIVANARPLSKDQVMSYQAGIFIGKEAVSKGLADGIMGWDELLETLNANDFVAEKTFAKFIKNESTSKTRLATYQLVGRAKEKRMSLVAMKALLRRTESAYESEKDPKKKLSLMTSLASTSAAIEAYKKTKHMIEKHETEEGEEDDEEESEESSEESSEAKGNETDRKEESDDSDDEDDSDGEDDDSDAKKASSLSKKALAAIEKATGMKGTKALGAASALFATALRNAEDIAKMKRTSITDKKATLIKGAVGALVTKKEAEWLSKQPLASVEGFVAMRRNAGGLIHTTDEELVVPGGDATTPTALPKEVMASIEAAVVNAPSGLDKDVYRKQLVANHTKAHNSRLSAGLNGIGRY